MPGPTTVPFRREQLRQNFAALDLQSSGLLLPLPWRLGLKNLSLGIMQVFDLTECIMIGRGLCDPDTMPFLDMTPYAAHEMGVSRRHVILQRKENGIFIIDNNSSNGVVLNGEILRPAQAYPVSHGDTFSMGMMHLEIRFLRNPFTR